MTDLREELIERAWDAMDNRNDVNVGLVDLAEVAVDSLNIVALVEALEEGIALERGELVGVEFKTARNAWLVSSRKALATIGRG